MKQLLPNLILAFSCLVANSAYPQHVPADSSTFDPAQKDSSSVFKTGNADFANNSPDTTIAQSPIQPVSVGLDSPVVYSARVFDSREDSRTLYLIGEASVRYKNFAIKADMVTVLWDENTLIAEIVPDTVVASAGGDTMRFRSKGQPYFSDGREEMYGDRMEFNFKSERGRIIRGRSDFQGGYYKGQTVKRVQPRVFFVRDGLYTTCDKEEPHFHFKGKKMKVILDDKVVAKPIIMTIGKIPVAVLPFAMFEIKESGRQSGVIIPQFGVSQSEGRYLRNLGYYWATNDYLDMRFTLDFFEKTGILFQTYVNYALRYRFTGAISGSFTNKNFTSGRRQRRWDFSVRHNQTIDQNTNLAINGTFVSDNTFYKDLSTDRDDRLSRQIISNATFSRSSSDRKNSLSINLSQTKDLELGTESLTLPQIRFSRSRTALFPFAEQTDVPGTASKQPRWFNYIQYDYKGFFQNTARKSSSDDSLDFRWLANHDVTLSLTNPGRFFGWLSLTQNVVFDEDWFDRTNTFSADTSGNVQPGEDEGFAARHLFRYSANANTNLYGTFFPNIGPIKALRHKLSPSISFTYQPDYTTDFWGYFSIVKDADGDTLRDSQGRPVKRDRFGGTPSVEQNRLGFSLNNLFQMKWGEGQDEKKIDLFNLNFSSGYNFAAEQFKLDNLRSSFFANPRRNLNVTMSMTHSFYKFDREAQQTVDELVSPRLTQFNLDLRWSIGGTQRTAGSQTGPQQAEVAEEETLSPEEIERERLASGDATQRIGSQWSLGQIPWSATVGFSYSLSRFNPDNPTRTAYLNLSNVQIQLTKNWRIGYRMRWDIEGGDIAEQSITFYRDLHCWEAQFNWNPTGITKGFYFRIGIKAAHLRDIKFEQRGGTTTIFRGF